jgi:hypothetical protein
MACYGGETYFDYGTAGYRKLGNAIKFVNLIKHTSFSTRLVLGVDLEWDFFASTFTRKR